MDKAGYAVLLALLLACNNEKKTETPAVADEENAAFSYEQFAHLFPAATAPYQLTDTALQNNKDTTTIRNKNFLSMIPDSVEEKLFGRNARIKYSPLVKVELPEENYFLLKGVSGSKRNVILLNFHKNGEMGAAFPFLAMDNDNKTTQTSILDKNGSITRTVLRKMPDDVLAEGKDVYVYNRQTNHFDLIMTDLLDDSNLELINPIDTLARTHKWAGDYTKGKNNLVSVRDGRKPELLTVFIHIEKNEGACVGEIKGDAQITAPSKAVYRQAGDPCVLELNFKRSTVTLKEMEGCGSRRGLECSFNGSFTRKKEASDKTSEKSKKTTSKRK